MQCKFADEDLLPGIANEAMKQTQDQRTKLIAQLIATMTSEQKRLLTDLDDLTIREINNAIDHTVHTLHCPTCTVRQGTYCPQT